MFKVNAKKKKKKRKTKAFFFSPMGTRIKKINK